MPHQLSETEPSGQRILDLGHSPALDQQSFLVSDSNREALLWIDRWPEWPSHGLILCGPNGCGKSHLLTIWSRKNNAIFISSDNLNKGPIQDLIAGYRHIALDNADDFFDATGERALFHLYNALKEQGLTLLLSGKTFPSNWPIQLPDLKSRLLSLPAISIAAPDDDLLARLFVKLFADRQITVSLDVIGYLLPRMERSFAAAHRLVNRLDELAMIEKRPITVSMARMVIEGIGD